MTLEELENIQPSPEPWTLPSPPDIEFLVPQRKAWTQIPKTINQTNDYDSIQQKSSKPSKSINKNSSLNATDNLTAATATTFQSDNIDVISKLQDESRQHSQLIDDHTNRIQAISQQIQELQSLQSWTDRILNLETKYEKIMKHNSDISSDLNNISNYTIPAITATLTGIKEIVTINDTKLNKVEEKVKQKLQRQQREIDNLYMIINTLHEFQNNPVTPSDLRRKKKNKQRSNEDKLNTEFNDNNSQMSEDDQHTIETTTETIRHNSCTTEEFHQNQSVQMSPINANDITSNEEQLFTMEEFNQTDSEISRQDSILNYSIDPETSQTAQNTSTGLVPRNLESLHFPILDDDNKNNKIMENNTKDLDNLRPGSNT
jgi:hypothetical protein